MKSSEQGQEMNWTTFVFSEFFEVELKIYIKRNEINLRVQINDFLYTYILSPQLRIMSLIMIVGMRRIKTHEKSMEMS